MNHEEMTKLYQKLKLLSGLSLDAETADTNRSLALLTLLERLLDADNVSALGILGFGASCQPPVKDASALTMVVHLDPSSPLTAFQEHAPETHLLIIGAILEKTTVNRYHQALTQLSEAAGIRGTLRGWDGDEGSL